MSEADPELVKSREHPSDSIMKHSRLIINACGRYPPTLSSPKPHRLLRAVPLTVPEERRDVLFLFFSAQPAPPLAVTSTSFLILARLTARFLPREETPVLHLPLSHKVLLSFASPLPSRKCTDDDAFGNPYDAPRQ